MCGIAGYYGDGDIQILKQMAGSLNYRGPDDDGYFEQQSVGLAHKRLSIIDLSQAGHQPMGNEAGDVEIVFNGEIYNFKELRESLRDKYEFRGDSDTEVILHLYEEVGAEVFSRIQGMFAIAIYDSKKNKLFLARDRMGKKPLYYGIFDGTLLFGSELKALMAHPKFKKEIDISSLNKYFLYEYVPTPNTMFKDVYKLEPGHYASYNGQILEKTKYWDISFENKEVYADLTLREAVEQLDNLLYKAVKKRLMSDVPLGIFLSGGIDSSTIAYYAQKILKETDSNKKIKTFSIGFIEDSFDESRYAREVAEFLGTEHHEEQLGAKSGSALVPRISDLLDEPLADASIIPTYLLSKFTRESVTVALGGDGSDELLYGYDTFVAERLAAIYEKIPKTLRKNVIERFIPLLPTSYKNMSLEFKAKKFVSGFYGQRRYRHQRWLGAFDKVERSKLFNQVMGEQMKGLNEFENIDILLDGVSVRDNYDELTYLYLRTYLMDDVLVKVDRASMYNSLEVRAPFLDTEVVEFLANIPLSLKLKGVTTKYLLKELMKDKLPHEIVYRKKKGFGIPLAEWLSGELKEKVTDALSEERINQQGLFDYKYIHTLLEDHFAKRRDNRKQIWTLFVFQMWYSRWYI